MTKNENMHEYVDAIDNIEVRFRIKQEHIGNNHRDIQPKASPARRRKSAAARVQLRPHQAYERGTPAVQSEAPDGAEEEEAERAWPMSANSRSASVNCSQVLSPYSSRHGSAKGDRHSRGISSEGRRVARGRQCRTAPGLPRPAGAGSACANLPRVEWETDRPPRLPEARSVPVAGSQVKLRCPLDDRQAPATWLKLLRHIRRACQERRAGPLGTPWSSGVLPGRSGEAARTQE